jgi:hypothetical protein
MTHLCCAGYETLVETIHSISTADQIINNKGVLSVWSVPRTISDC